MLVVDGNPSGRPPRGLGNRCAARAYLGTMSIHPCTLSVATAVAAFAAVSCAPADAGPGSTAAASGPIVVELFTSQGCSSCPPADALLSDVAAHPGGGRAILPLAYHVDYWNDLGWADPFSRAAWSERQQRYAAARGDGEIYTPQLIVAGGRHVVGSNLGAVRAALASAPPATALAATLSRDGDRLRVTATAPAGAEVWLALCEDGLVTRVARGENAGRALRNDRVVRALVRVGPGGADLRLDPSWRRDRLGAVAFAQRPDTLAIVAATALAVPAP